MESKKINQLATNVNPQTSDLTTIGDPVTGQLKKITWLQVAHLIGAQASVTLQQVTDNGNTTTDPITTGGLTLTNLGTGVPQVTNGEFVSTYGYGLANGVATLDSGGKIPASQLPSSVMEYKGTWNASTNTPTLADGTGDNGDVYLVNVAGSQNLGSGTISFAVGDWVVYNGTIWQKSLNSNAVASVFGRTGTIVAQEGDYNIDQLGDVAITSAATNDYLRYNGSSWVNTQFPTFVSSDKLILQVRNTSGATINKGTVVYVNGASGGYPTIAKALADADNTSAQTLGLVQDNISNNSNGVVVIVGQITGVDTSAYPAGTQLYLSGTTAGAFTSTKTLAPTHLVYVGIVTTQNAVNGVIEVKIQNGYELDEIHDVAISSVANNQGLFYESSTSLWKNKSIATVLGYTPEQPLTFSAPLSRSTNTVSIPAATGSVNGYLTSTDWTTFNNKLTSPMTTLGDIIFGGTSGNPNRLAGNTTTTKQYLSQTGTGTESASPTWATIAGSDITGAALTKSDDTNVTLTLGGTPSTALLRAASLTLGWTGTLAVSRGGTGASSFGSNEIIYGNSASALQSSSQFTFSPTGVFFINNTISAGGIAMNLVSTVNAAANNDIIYGVRISPTFNNGAFTGVTQRALGVFGNVYINGTITGAGWGGSVIGSNYGGAGTVSGILKANGSGVVSAAVAGTDYQAPLTNPVTGTGTNNYITKFTTTGSTIGNSILFDDGTNIGLNTSTPSTYGHGGNNRGLEIRNTNTSSNSQSHVILSTNAVVGGSIGSITWVIPNTANANKFSAYIASNITQDSTSNPYGNLVLGVANGSSVNVAQTINSDRTVSFTNTISGTTASFSISSNSAIGVSSRNTNAGTAAGGTIFLGNDSTTNGAGLTLFSSGFSASAQYRTDGAYFYSNRAGGLTVHAEGANSMYLATNGTTALTFNSSQAATFTSAFAGYGLSVTNVEDSSQGLLVRSTDADTTLYLARFQSSASAVSQTWVDRFSIAKNGSTVIGDNIPAVNVRLWVKGSDQTASNYAMDVTDSAGQSIAWFRNDKAVRFYGGLTATSATFSSAITFTATSGYNIDSASDIILANAKPLRSYTTFGSGWRLISLESDNNVHIAGNGGNIIMNGGGNVGIGVIPAAWRSTDKVLQINNSALYDESGTNFWLGLNFYENSSGSYIFNNSGYATAYRQASGEHRWFISNNGAAGGTVSFTTAMTITNVGAVQATNNFTANSPSEGNTGEGIIAGRSFKIDASGTGQTAKMYVVSKDLSDTYGSGLQIQFANYADTRGFGFNLTTSGNFELYNRTVSTWQRNLVVTQAGAVITPNQIVAIGALVNNQSISSSSFTILNFDTGTGYMARNIGSAWNNTTRTFNAPQSGIYQVTISVYTNCIEQVAMYIDGSRNISIPAGRSISSDTTWGGSCMVYIPSGSDLTLRGYGNNSGTLYANGYHTWFQIRFLG